MIYFETEQEWLEFKKLHYKASETIIIDLQGCNSEDEYMLALSDVLHASFSNKFSFEGDLTDIASDYFAENWLDWKTIYILGWQKLTEKNPSFSQYVIVSLMDAYLKAISYMLRAVDYGDIKVEDLKLQIALEDDLPRFYLVLN